ncbi:ATP-binding protein [Neptunomonas qingdaonensis]|uniref:histidine kinase n=1 Tax=Neptunomonas qingdaonensis TaxID=1045558 RepID=A0A1I2QQM6_9GAMM|nr:ATP-binding protein [Neptunomonas qingdaonensis]SFG30905.1 Signal transduction histidine kinase [Neptunomonas qingdaonensis]
MYFRTRIFAMSILTVSAVLAMVISLSWSRIMQVELDHLDSRLCMEAKRIPNRLEKKLEENDFPANVSILSDTELLGSRLIDDLVDKLRVSSPSQLMILVESSQHGILTKSEGADVQHIISRLNWVRADPLQPTDKNRRNALCQVAFFEHQQNQWRASLFQAPDKQSFIAVDVAATTRQLQSTLRQALIVVIPFSLLLSILGAWFIASNTIRPIKRLHKSMDRVTQKDLSHRLPEHKEDTEFKMLIDAYNTMLERLEDSFQQVSRFTADAAHELKTPLTVLRGKLEQAVLSENPSQLDLNSILDEVGHLSAITRKLLLLSQADSCSLALHLEPINMTELLDELTADMELMSDELVLHCSIERELITKGDIVLLRQLLNNLLVNVMRYSLHDKGVTIQASQNESCIEVLISNACVAMSSEVRSQLFDRFYRGEPEHSQGLSGSGLGLSLAREIARAHGGDLTLEPSVKEVVTMRLILPIVK